MQPSAFATMRLPIDQILPRPGVPLSPTDPELRELTASISRDGLIQPLTVRPLPDGRYQVVSGNRRLLACRLCGLNAVETRILPSPPPSPRQMLLDALSRGDQDPVSEAEALGRLRDEEGVPPQQIARLLGREETEIENRLRLLSLPEDVRAQLRDRHLPLRMAEALLRLDDPEEQRRIIRQATQSRLGVADVELLVTSALRHAPQKGRAVAVMRDYRLYLNAIRTLVEQMQQAGLAAELGERTLGGQVEVTVRIPVRRRRSARYRHLAPEAQDLAVR